MIRLEKIEDENGLDEVRKMFREYLEELNENLCFQSTEEELVSSGIKFYDILREKLGEKEAETFMQVLDETVQRKVDSAKSNLATKEDLHQTKIDLIKRVFAFWITLLLMIAGLYLKK